jgi:hypothetical protein
MNLDAGLPGPSETGASHVICVEQPLGGNVEPVLAPEIFPGRMLDTPEYQIAGER